MHSYSATCRFHKFIHLRRIVHHFILQQWPDVFYYGFSTVTFQIPSSSGVLVPSQHPQNVFGGSSNTASPIHLMMMMGQQQQHLDSDSNRIYEEVKTKEGMYFDYCIMIIIVRYNITRLQILQIPGIAKIINHCLKPVQDSFALILLLGVELLA